MMASIFPLTSVPLALELLHFLVQLAILRFCSSKSFFSVRSSLSCCLSFSFSVGQLVDVINDLADLPFKYFNSLKFGSQFIPP